MYLPRKTPTAMLKNRNERPIPIFISSPWPMGKSRRKKTIVEIMVVNPTKKIENFIRFKKLSILLGLKNYFTVQKVTEPI
jgi:hypothetical protein